VESFAGEPGALSFSLRGLGGCPPVKGLVYGSLVVVVVVVGPFVVVVGALEERGVSWIETFWCLELIGMGADEGGGLLKGLV
jgi:hypothetical protein